MNQCVCIFELFIAIASEWNFNALFDSRTNRCFERGGDVTICISLVQFSVQLSDIRDCIAMAFTAICARVSLSRQCWEAAVIEEREMEKDR